MNAISLFSGMGGDSLGLTNAGFNLVAYSEKEKQMKETHDLNFKDCELIGSDVGSDIKKITDDEFLKYKDKVDLIFAGFPCQGFSNAGKKKLNDPRNTLFNEFVRATKLINPKFIIGENVKGLLSRKTHDKREYIEVIEEEFNKLNYNIIYKVFTASKYGVPQKRQRLIILGVRRDLNKTLSFPDELNTETNLKNIVEFNMKGAIHVPKEHFDISTLPKHSIMEDMSNDETENSPHPYLKLKATSVDTEYKGKTHETLLSFSKRDSPIHCEIIDLTKPSKTIICTYDHQPRLFVALHNKNGYFLRCLLPDELKQIQGFPKDYKVSGNTKKQTIQIGNAVPPPLIELIGRHILTL